MINILIADDHAIVRDGLKQVFSQTEDIYIAGEAENGIEVINLLQQENIFDLLLLDLTMPGISGINLIARVRPLNKSLPILVFSMHSELQVAKRVLQAGASGFITKGCSHEILVSAIRKVAAGGRYVDPVLAEQLISEKPVPEAAVPHDRLTARELYILKQLARGKTVNEIADELFISNKTVSTHKTRLMQKMNLQSNAELVRYAADIDLIE